MRNFEKQHYHCSKCGKVLDEIGRLEWDADKGGVRVIYYDGKHIFFKREDREKLYRLNI